MRNAAGLDISKDTIDAAVVIGDSVQTKKYSNDETGIKQLESWLQTRSEEHTSELQSLYDLVCRLLRDKKK